MNNYEHFLFLEDKNFFSQQLGEVLGDLQKIKAEADTMGKRQVLREVNEIVCKIRNILKDTWPKNTHKHLSKIQQVGVALAKLLDEPDDNMPGIFEGCIKILASVAEKIGAPINEL